VSMITRATTDLKRPKYRELILYKCHLYLFTYTGFQHIMFVLLNSKTTSVTGGTGTANPSGAHEFTPIFVYCGSCCSTFSFLCCVCRSLFVRLSFFFGH